MIDDWKLVCCSKKNECYERRRNVFGRMARETLLQTGSGHGVRPRYHSCGGTEPSFRLDTPSQVALSGFARLGLCGQAAYFQFGASEADFPLLGKTLISG